MYDEICYNKNFIEEVIVRIDFSNSVNDFISYMPKEIGKIIKDRFPIAEPQDVIGAELQINGPQINGPQINGQQINTQQMGFSNLGLPIISKQWVFNSRDRKNQCIVTPNSVIFKYNAYNIYSDLKIVVNDIITSINNAYPNIDAKRLGMRYVNNIRLNGDNGLIVDEYITALNNSRSSHLIRSVTVVEYSLEQDDINIRHQYGFMNKDYPAILNSDDFTIDIDAYVSGLLYLDEVDELMDKMHKEIQRVFENSITDKLRDIMK